MGVRIAICLELKMWSIFFSAGTDLDSDANTDIATGTDTEIRTGGGYDVRHKITFVYDSATHITAHGNTRTHWC